MRLARDTSKYDFFFFFFFFFFFLNVRKNARDGFVVGPRRGKVVMIYKAISC